MNERSFALGPNVNQPDRSPPQAEHRAIEILEGVRLAFIEKGFDGASMQDLARACGMSVGNFYRYFPSKAAIVAALVTRDLAEVEEGFSQIIKSPNPMATLRIALQQRIEDNQCQGDGQLWAEMTAASLRKPEIAEITRQMETEVARYLSIVFAQVLGIPAEIAKRRYAAHCSLLVMMIKASAMHRAENDEARDQMVALAVRTMNRILDEIVSDDVKG